MNLDNDKFPHYSYVANVILCIVVGILLINNFSEKQLRGEANNHASASPKQVSIAIMGRASYPAFNTIIQGFKEELAKDPRLQCSYTMYDHGSDKKVLRTDLEDVINTKNFDLIFTIGYSASFITAELTKKRRCHIPIVFAAVQDPVSLGIVPQDRSRSCFITGSSSEAIERHELQFSLLLFLNPDMPRLLITYDSTPDIIIQREIANVEKFMQNRSIPVEKIAVSSIAECLGEIGKRIQEGDVIWVPRDLVVAPNVGSVVKLASRYNAIVYASSSDAIAEGAALVFATDDKVSGYNAGKKAREILVYGKHPSEVPITSPICNYHLLVNEPVLKLHGLKLDERLLFLMEKSKVARENLAINW